jgi:hypothetical protein
MLTLTGQLINTFTTPAGERNGEPYPETNKIQLLGEIPLPNGEVKNGLIDLTSHSIGDFKNLETKKIRVPVGAMVSGKNVIYFIPKGSKPEVVSNHLERA